MKIEIKSEMENIVMVDGEVEGAEKKNDQSQEENIDTFGKSPRRATPTTELASADFDGIR